MLLFKKVCCIRLCKAADETRTRNTQLGGLALYQLNYCRTRSTSLINEIDVD